jgi:alkylation response protein AidB-like acyl-CoA dehydrogenase
MTMTIDERAAMHWSGARLDTPWMDAAKALVPELAAVAAEHDRTGSFPVQNIARLKDAGLTAMLVPTEVGGGGASHADLASVLAELAHGCPATSLTLSMHSHLVAAQVWRHHRGLPAPVLPRVANDRVFLVSTGASDWVESEGTAVQVDGGFRVSGRKVPASGAPAGDVLVSSARWASPDGPQVIHFSAPFSAPGVSIVETWDTMGMRATGSHTVVLDDVFVPEAAVSLTRPAGPWHPIWDVVVGVAMPLIMAVYVGVAEAAVERALEVAGSRRDADVLAPLAGRMVNRLRAAQDAVGTMVALSEDLRFDNTVEHTDAVLSRRTEAATASIDATRLALELAGGAGYATATGIERLFRDVHGALYHPLPSAKQERLAGRLALGLDPFA